MRMRKTSVASAATADPPAGAPARPPVTPWALRTLYRFALRPLFGTGLYRAALAGKAPSGFQVRPPAHWPGQAARGAAIADGAFQLAGQTIRQLRNPWQAFDASEAWLTELHGFGWLDDLIAYADGGDRTRAIGAARTLILDWIARHRGWAWPAWRADVIGARIAAWLTHFDAVFAGAEDAERKAALDSLARQLRHLRRVAGIEVEGGARLVALKGLIYGGTCLPDWAGVLPRTMQRITQELDRQILPDGGHVERGPAMQLTVLRHLVDIRALLRVAHREMPEGLQSAIDRMAPMVRFFRHADGGLALFNDSAESEPGWIDRVLAEADARGRAPSRAPHSGFERLAIGRLFAIIDAGAPAPARLDRHAHAGTLALEVDVGNTRVIVNCGPAPAADPAWRAAQRATAAHSTLAIDDTNSSEVLPGAESGLGRRPTRVLADRDEQEGHVWLFASHDGYAHRFGLIHRRRLFLDAAGADLRGEDSLDPVDPARPVGAHGFTVRFHLHPEIDASLVQDGTAVLLRLPGSGRNRPSGWWFRAEGGGLALADSIYLGSGETRRTQQIVISGVTGPSGVTVKWAMQQTDAAR